MLFTSVIFCSYFLLITSFSHYLRIFPYKVAFAGATREFLVGYGLCEDDDAAVNELAEKLRQACLPLVKLPTGGQNGGPSSHSSSAPTLRKLEDPVTWMDVKDAGAEAAAALEAPARRGVAIMMGQQLMANTSEGLPQQKELRLTNARKSKLAAQQQREQAMRTWQSDETKKEARAALEVRSLWSLPGACRSMLTRVSSSTIRPSRTIPFSSSTSSRLPPQQTNKQKKVYLEALEKSPRHSGDIILGDVTVMQPGTTSPLLDHAQLRIVTGRRYGLIGRNGIGKTTLLRKMATYELPGFPRTMKVFHVAQHVDTTHARVIDYVMAADLERERLLQQERILRPLAEGNKPVAPAGSTETSGSGAPPEGQAAAAEASPAPASSTEASAASITDPFGSAGPPTTAEEAAMRLQRVYERLNEMESYAAEARAAEILTGLQFSKDMHTQPVSSLSGGWRQRCGLAAALFVAPDLLLLDEPTNHLDFPAVLWLQEYLKTYKSTVVVVSHDRTFLDEVVTDVIFFANKTLTYYRGNYSTFVRVKEEQFQARLRAFEAQQMQRQHMQGGLGFGGVKK